MATLRNFTRRFFIIANLVVIVLFLLACVNAYLHPAKWWFISILGLIFPLLLALVLLFVILWLFFSRPYWAVVCLVVLLIGWKNIHAFFGFNLSASFQQNKPDSALRIITWNVRRWDEFITNRIGASGHRMKMLDFLKEQNGDVLCLQEFFESHNPREIASNIPYIQQQLHYPYFYFSRDYVHYNGVYESGVVIFSKFPIIDSARIKYDNKEAQRAAESLISVDLDVNGKTIRVFTTHLQSVLFGSKEFRDIEIIKSVDDSSLQASKSIVKKLRRAYGLRGTQADVVREAIDKSPFPTVICGDFNDVPNSYAYFHIRGDMQDAFITKGFGVGRSYVHISPTLRIDYIFAGNRLSVLQCKKFDLPYSDHHPVVADIVLKN